MRSYLLLLGLLFFYCHFSLGQVANTNNSFPSNNSANPAYLGSSTVSTPVHKLYVGGSVKLFHNGNSGLSSPSLYLGNTTAGARTYYFNSNSAGLLRIVDSNANVDRFVINTSGNVGINTSTPSYRLDVNGAIGIQNTNTSSYSAIDFQDYAGTHKLGIGYANPSAAFNPGTIYINAQGDLNLNTFATTRLKLNNVKAEFFVPLETTSHIKPGSTSADPTGTNGMLYYNTSINRLRTFSNSAWQSIVTSGDIQNGLTYNSSGKLVLGSNASHGARLSDNAYIALNNGTGTNYRFSITGEPFIHWGGVVNDFTYNSTMIRAGEGNGYNQNGTLFKVGHFDADGNDKGESNNSSQITTQEILNNGWGTNGAFRGLVVRMNGNNFDNNYNLTGVDINTRHHYTNTVNTNGTAGNIALKLTANSVGAQGWMKALTYAIYADSGRVYSRDSVMFGTTTPGAFFHVNGTSRFDLGSDQSGDIFYRNSSGLLTRLPIGSANQVLTVSEGLPAWTNAGGGEGPSQWTTSGSNIYYNTGNVGINIRNPVYPFHVAPVQYSSGTASQSGTTITGSGVTWHEGMVDGYVVFADGTQRTITAFIDPTHLTVAESGTVSNQAYKLHVPGLGVAANGQTTIANSDWVEDLLTVKSGIGTWGSGVAKFVSVSPYASGTYNTIVCAFAPNVPLGTNINAYQFGKDRLSVNNSATWLFRYNGDMSASNYVALAFWGSPEIVRFNPNGVTEINGLVKIGTPSNPDPSDANLKLAVNGHIYSKKVKVTQTGWADYVFEKNYPLPNLKEVEAFILKHKHLPDVPSATEVEKNGLDLGDNQSILLKKIEELTLYMIEMNKKIEQLSAENKELKLKVENK